MKFKCNICDSTFTEKGSLERHIISIHEEKMFFTCHSALRVIQTNLQKTWKRLSWHSSTYSRESESTLIEILQTQNQLD